jgi:polysaccharide biosynthesis protein PslG
MEYTNGGTMKSPFWEHVKDLFARFSGRSLIVVGTIWIVLMGVALACGFGLIELPSGQPPTTAAPTRPATLGAPTPDAGTTDTNPPATTDATVLPTPTVAAASQAALPPLPWGEFGYGIAAHAIQMPSYTMGQIKDHLGLSWVKQQVRWDHFSLAPGQMDWSGYDGVVFFAEEKGLKVMMSVVGAPDWSRSYFDDDPQAAPPDDLSLFVNFLAEMVDRYKGKIHAIEVWNEQNLDREWDTAEGVKAERYVEMLRLSYQAIKSRDPNIIVISGALSPTGVTATDPQNPSRFTVVDDFVYFQQMIDAGFLNYCDCVGAHHNGYNLPPNVAFNEGYDEPTASFRGPFDSPHPSWSFKSTLWGYHEMIKAEGRNTPLCVTEFGWATSEGFDGAPRGFEFANDNTLEEQTQWNMEAFQLLREWGFVHLAFLWNLDYSYKGGLGATDPNSPYSILDLTGAPRPAFEALGGMPKIP